MLSIYSQELSQSGLFEKISKICEIGNESFDADRLLTESLRGIKDLFNVARCSIFILDENTDKLILKAAHGIANEKSDRIVHPIGESVIGQVIKKKEPIVVEDLFNDRRFSRIAAGEGYQTNSFICAPLLLKDKLIGVINITDKKDGLPFNVAEMQMLDFLSTQIAVNYQRLKLYAKFKIFVKETQELRDKLGQSDERANQLKRQVDVHQKLATIGKLAGGLAHEFNNPLDGLIRYTNLCLEEGRDNKKLTAYLEEMKSGLLRMTKIVKNLLACSRNNRLQTQKIDFRNVLNNALALKKDEITDKNIKVLINTENNLPSIVDLGLERILANLIHNAVDAMPENGVLKVDALQHDQKLIFSVRDTGCGIPEEKLASIFDPFYTTKDSERGCGLGLTIVSEIVKFYNGQIHVDSALGHGTQFTVKLPYSIDG